MNKSSYFLFLLLLVSVLFSTGVGDYILTKTDMASLGYSGYGAGSISINEKFMTASENVWAKAKNSEHGSLGLVVRISTSFSPLDFAKEKSYYTNDMGYICNQQATSLVCTETEANDQAQWNSRVYQYFGYYYGHTYVKKGNKYISIELMGRSEFNKTNELPAFAKAVESKIIAKITAESSHNAKIKILSPTENSVFQLKENNIVIPVKVQFTNDGDVQSVDVYYESGNPKPTLIGGQVAFDKSIINSAQTIEKDIILSKSDVPNGKGKINVYAKYKDESKISDTISIYVYDKNHKGGQTNQNANSGNDNKSGILNLPPVNTPNIGNVENGINNAVKHIKTTEIKKQTKGIVSSIINGLKSLLGSENSEYGYASHFKIKPKNVKIQTQTNKIDRLFKGIHSNGQLSELKLSTPSGRKITIVNSDDVVTRTGVKKGTSLWFKLKYYANKYMVDPIIDGASSLLPKPLGIYKDYVKSDKDVNVYNSTEEVQKTAKDLHVDKKTADLYNKLSNIENKEKNLSTVKNTVANVPLVAKPMEFALNALSGGTKKIIAHYYRKEYDYVVKQAKYYRDQGMKWKNIHDIVKRDVDEQKEGMVGLHQGEEFTATQYLNTNSVPPYKNINARIDLYIAQAQEYGDLK